MAHKTVSYYFRFFALLLGMVTIPSITCSLDIDLSNPAQELFLPSPWKERLDKFFKENNITKHVSAVQKAYKKKLLGKRIGCGARAIVIQTPLLDNKFVLKILNPWKLKKRKSKKRLSIKLRDMAAPTSWFSSCAIRENVSRVFKAAQINDVIQKNGWKNIRVPKKYLYHIPGAPQELTDENYIVVAEMLDFDSSKKVYADATREQILNFLRIMIEEEHTDNADGNIVIDKDGIFTIADTDNMWMLMQRKEILSKKDLKDLADFCTRKIISWFRKTPPLKQAFRAFYITLSEDECADEFLKIITLYRKLCILTTVMDEINGRFIFKRECIRRGIIKKIQEKWLDVVCSKFNLKRRSRIKLAKIFDYLERLKEPTFSEMLLLQISSFASAPKKLKSKVTK